MQIYIYYIKDFHTVLVYSKDLKFAKLFKSGRTCFLTEKTSAF